MGVNLVILFDERVGHVNKVKNHFPSSWYGYHSVNKHHKMNIIKLLPKHRIQLMQHGSSAALIATHQGHRDRHYVIHVTVASNTFTASACCTINFSRTANQLVSLQVLCSHENNMISKRQSGLNSASAHFCSEELHQSFSSNFLTHRSAVPSSVNRRLEFPVSSVTRGLTWRRQCIVMLVIPSNGSVHTAQLSFTRY